MKAAGAEADTSAVQARAEDEGWIKAELSVLFPFFSLHPLKPIRIASNFVYVPAPCVSI